MNSPRSGGRLRPSILALALLAGGLWLRGGETRFQYLTNDDGLSQNSVYSMLQDRQGFIWFGTEEGLNRYDGYSFTVFRHRRTDSQSPIGNMIRALRQDRQGRIWIGTGNGLSCYDPARGSFVGWTHREDRPDSLSSEYVNCLEVGRDGSVWIGGRMGHLDRLDPQTGKIRRLGGLAGFPAPAPGNAIRAMVEDRQGDLWVAGARNGLFRISGRTERLQRFGHDPNDPGSLSHDIVYDLCLDDRGQLWIGTAAGLDRFDRPSGRFVHPVSFSSGSGASTSRIAFRILADSSGTVWISSTDGLHRYLPSSDRLETVLPDPPEPGDPEEWLTISMLEDRSGNLWFGTQSHGVRKFNRRFNQLRHLHHQPGREESLAGSTIHALAQDRSGAIWIGTDGASLDRWRPEDDRFLHFPAARAGPEAPDDNVIYSLLLDSRGSLWIGNGTNGLSRRDPLTGRFTHYLSDPQNPAALPRGTVIALLEEASGTLLIGIDGGGLCLLPPDRDAFVRLNHVPGDPASLPSDFVSALYGDRQGVVWVGTTTGLSRFDPFSRRFQPIADDPGDPRSLAGNYVTAMLEDRAGNFWVGTYGDGLKRLDRARGTLQAITEANGLSNDFVCALLEDELGDIWISTNNGLSRYDPLRRSFLNFAAGDGIQNREFVSGAALKTAEGQLWFGGINGLTRFDPRQIEIDRRSPPVVITAVRVGSRPLPLSRVFADPTRQESGGVIVLPPGERLVSMDFAALDFSAPAKNRFAFCMGGDREWIDLGSRHSLSFGNLAPGAFALQVRGSNRDGIWNQAGVRLQIVVRPFFWQTRWFRLLALLALALLVTAVVYVRRRFLALKRIAEPVDLDGICAAHNISKREQEILRLVIQGKSNSQIENELYISIKTVKAHIYNIYQKFGVSSRLQLINFLQGKKTD